MGRKYFGTDGVRGKAGAFPLDGPTLHALGRAAGAVLGDGESAALVAMDTRESGPEIAAHLVGGLRDAGVSCRHAGVLPTPGAAHLVRGGFAFAAMVTASHNPFEDNGVKFFSADGYKLPDGLEERIEGELDALLARASAPGTAGPLRPAEEELGERYFQALLGGWNGPLLEGRRIVLDCAHGAAHRFAPRLFESLGAEVVRLGCAPDGRNINRDCGSLHLDALRAAVSEGAWAGFAFDGDADRCLAVTPEGTILDGDYLLYHESLRRRAEGTLAGPVVGTVMSNLWLEQALGREGIPFRRATVGDRYVLESLHLHGGVLGGEPSGHILFLDRTTTGDGLLTALAYAAIARDAGGMRALTEGIRPYPQVLRNLRVGRRTDLESDGAVQKALAAEEARLGGRGRIVLRFSGTEALLRLMVEAQDAATVEASLNRLSAFLLDHLGQG